MGQQRAKVGGDPPQEEEHRSPPWESLKFGVLKLSHLPEIKKLGHRLGEHRVETAETGVLDGSSVKAPCRLGSGTFSSRAREPSGSIFILPISIERLLGMKWHHIMEGSHSHQDHLHVPWRHTFTETSYLENQQNSPLHQKTSTNNSLIPGLLNTVLQSFGSRGNRI